MKDCSRRIHINKRKLAFGLISLNRSMSPVASLCLMLEGEEQEKAIEGVYENLSVLEQGLCNDFPAAKTSSFFNGETFGYLSIAICLTSCSSHEAFQEAVGAKSKIMDPEKHPLFMSCVNAVSENPLAKGIIPRNDKMVEIVT